MAEDKTMNLQAKTLALGMTAMLALAGCASNDHGMSVTEVETRMEGRTSSAMAAANEAKKTAQEALALARQAQEDADAAKRQAMAANERADRTFQASLAK